MSRIRVEVDEIVHRPVEQVFQRAIDLESYSDWMPPGGVFRRCRQTSEGQVGLGTTFDDQGWMGTFRGEVVEFERPSRVVYKERLRWFGRLVMDATVRYEFAHVPQGTALHHIGESELHGLFRLMRPVVVVIGNRERRRTVRALKRTVEAEGSGATVAAA